MVSNRKKRQSNRRLLSQLDDFDRDMIIGNAVSKGLENAVVNEGTDDQDFTVGTSNNDSVVNGSAMTVKTLERCFNEKIDREMSNIVDTVEDRIRNAILTAIEKIVAPRIELAVRSINASSGRDATNLSANSERRERVGVNASLENVSRNNDTLDVSNVNDETRHNIADEVSELSVPVTRFDRQPHTHHRCRMTSFIRRPTFFNPMKMSTNSIWCTYLSCSYLSLPFGEDLNQFTGTQGAKLLLLWGERLLLKKLRQLTGFQGVMLASLRTF